MTKKGTQSTTYIMKREQSEERQIQYASSSCFMIVAILLLRSGSSNSLAISSFCGVIEKNTEIVDEKK